MQTIANPDEMPSRRYTLSVYEAGTENLVQQKPFDPSLSDSRRGAIGTCVWAWSQGHEVTIDLVE